MVSRSLAHESDPAIFVATEAVGGFASSESPAEIALERCGGLRLDRTAPFMISWVRMIVVLLAHSASSSQCSTKST
jgi:hypothetical protein